MIPIAYYAPLKSPDHVVPSGDRTMGRLLRSALRLAGFEPELASGLRSLDIIGDPGVQRDIKAAAEGEAADLIAAFRARPAARRPRLWFTYHCHYKAPDWIGPRVAEALAIPYAVAEGSRSARRAQGPWALGHAGAEAALDAADCLFVMTPSDAEDLAPALRAGQELVALPPFLDASAWPDAAKQRRAIGDPLRLLTVAMMREGDKLASYRLLAEAFSRLPSTIAWTLDIVGDGPAAAAVAEMFGPLGARVRHHGVVHDRANLASLYRAADLLVWPAYGEAYGMTLLEAQACGCPVLAGREGGVPAVVRHGETGILVSPRDAGAFADGLVQLARSREELVRMGERAELFVREERDLPRTAAILRAALTPLVAASQAHLAEPCVS